jgi:hypothetical protein
MGDDDHLDQIYLSAGQGGFYQPESRITTGPEGHTTKVTYRWAGRTSFINLPWPTDAVPLKATLHASAPRPKRDPDKGGTTLKVTGSLEWDTLNLGRFDLTGLYEGSDYTFKIPVHLRPNLASLSLKFEASDLYPPEISHDPRALSVIFFSLKLEPDYAEFGWRGWLATFARPTLLAIITFCGWGIAALVWQRRRRALMLEGAVGLALLLTMFIWPLAAEPVYAAWAFILVMGWLMLGLAVLFCRRAVHLPAPFVYAATLFPLLPLAQFAFGRLDLYSLNPSSVIIGLYFCALCASLAFYIGHRAAPDPAPGFERAFVRSMLFASVVSFGYTHVNLWLVDIFRGSEFKLYYQASLWGMPLADPMPPALYLLLWPFSRLFGPDALGALAGWRIVNEALFLVCLFGLVKVFGGVRHGKNYTPAVLFLALNFGQIAETISYGQYSIIILLGFTLVAWAVRRNRPGLAGIALALPVALKPYAALTSLFLLKQKRRLPALTGLAGGWLLLLALSLLTTYNKAPGAYFSHLGAEFTQPSLDIANQSWWAFLGRLAQPLPDISQNPLKGGLPAWVYPVGYTGMLIMAGLTLFFSWRSRTGQDKISGERSQLELAAFICLSLLVPPVIWMYATTPALVAVLALLGFMAAPQTSRGQLLFFALAYAVLAYGNRFDFFNDEAVGLARLGSSYRFLACLAFWLLCLWGLRTRRAIFRKKLKTDAIPKDLTKF